MNSQDNENEKLIKELSEREAGVEDLYELYTEVEMVYTSAIKTLEEGQNTLITNSANRG